MAEDGIVFNWTGSGILFRFYGTAAAIMLEHSGPNLGSMDSFLSVRVDGGEVRRVGEWAIRLCCLFARICPVGRACCECD